VASVKGTTADMGSLFVQLTGRSTIVEHQADGVNHEVDDGDDAVAAYVTAASRATGFDDVIDVPDLN